MTFGDTKQADLGGIFFINMALSQPTLGFTRKIVLTFSSVEAEAFEV